MSTIKLQAIYNLPIRHVDSYGAGHYGASRGDRTHRGIDYYCTAGDKVLWSLPFEGTVTKFGYPYSDDLSYRYVQVTTEHPEGDGEVKVFDHRFFYVEPNTELMYGMKITEGTVLGKSQGLGKRYHGIPNHVHYEIKCDGKYIDPQKAYWDIYL